MASRQCARSREVSHVNLPIKSLTLAASLLVTTFEIGVFAAEEPIDRTKAKALYDKSQAGTKLTNEEQAYLDRARAEMRNAKAKPMPRRIPPPLFPGVRREQSSCWFETIAGDDPCDRYKGEDGGLYGGSL